MSHRRNGPTFEGGGGGEGRVEPLSARCAEGSRTWLPRHVGRYAAGLTGPYAEIVKYT